MSFINLEFNLQWYRLKKMILIIRNKVKHKIKIKINYIALIYSKTYIKEKFSVTYPLSMNL